MRQDSGPAAVFWWSGWIALTIFAFFIPCFFWTRIIARHVGGMDKPGTPLIWVAAVFGTWMIFLVPLIIAMYQKVDKAYEDARIAREKAASEKARAPYRSLAVAEAERQLVPALQAKLKRTPETLRNGHLVTAVLKGGRRVEHVFVLNKKDVLGVYGLETLDFKIGDIVDLEPVDLDRLPVFDSHRWIRFDGVSENE
ncbi:MAG: hypothetical protein HYT89_04585 [Candidatus Omnitrophica bacterium]|nr:hypothetical protein [Candidatus Omnitrophota bacterium]